MADVSEPYSEEKTEPYTDSQIESRFLSFRSANFEAAYNDPVSLDDLVVDDYHHQQGVRILVRPLTRSRSVSPGSDNCRLLALRAEVESVEEHKVLAVTQTWRDIKFSVRIPGDLHNAQPRPPVWCELYYDPTSDNQILVNRGDVPIVIKRLSANSDDSPPSEQVIVPGNLRALTPGTWNISAESVPVLDFRILERRPLALTQTAFGIDSNCLKGSSQNGSSKRSFSDGQLSPEKRARTDNGAIMFMTPQPLVLPLPHASSGNPLVSKKGDHPMIGLKRDEALSVTGGCELEKYQLTKKTQLHSSKLSTVFTASHSHSSIPDDTITVKVLKTAVQQDMRPLESERNVIRQADVWLRELETQLNLKHESIVRLYAGDARYLSLYMEHVDARDLSVKDIWRNPKDDMFLGTKMDATRILHDIAGGLNYLHQKRLVHNDIKPANILYSRERGAVLCDFGLTTPNNPNERATNGGTPYYVPPEYIGGMHRGPPSDVWALGVTMLYVLQKIPFPDVRSAKGHPKQLYWHISDINKAYPRDRSRRQPTAAEQMRKWLVEVREAKDKLDPKDNVESLVADMLTPDRLQRITMAKVMKKVMPRNMLEGCMP